MNDTDLVRMANQITAFWMPYPKTEAVDGIWKHINNFWDPRMRNQLKSFIDKDGQGLEPLFLEAATEYFKGPKPPGAKPAAAKSA